AADDIDVALIEFTITAFLGTVGPPNGTDVVTAERLGQFIGMISVITGEGNGEVKAKSHVRIVPRLFSLFEFFPTLENLEHQLLILTPTLTLHHLDIFHNGGINGLEAIKLVVSFDEPNKFLA